MSTDNEVLSKPLLFGKYCLLERISVGGMAEVFKAKQFGVEGFERLLAVKRILDTIAEDEVFIKMFIDEAKIAGQLNHPNIAQIFDLGKVDGSYFIALEYVSGKDLRTIWEKMASTGDPADIFLACHVVMKVCEALQYAHTKRDAAGNELHIVHRDISPQNILISYEGDVKIIDFGIAKATGKSSQTQVGILKGKFSYMSPEQVRGLHVDSRADIFSLGIVLYELLTNKRLFVGESDFDTLEKIRKVEMSPPTLYNPHIPRELEDVVIKALAKSPEERYQSGSELHDALERFMRNQSSYYGTKDLATSMKTAFATSIDLERKKLDYYRTINIESLGGDIGGMSSTSGDLSSISGVWAEESLDSQNFGRGGVHFNEISPAAEFVLENPSFSTLGGGSPLLSGPTTGELRLSASAPEFGFREASADLPGVDLNKPLDEEDDPTMEWGGVEAAAFRRDPSAPIFKKKSPSPPASPDRPGPASADAAIPSIFQTERLASLNPDPIEAPSSLEGRRGQGSSAGLLVAIVALIMVMVLGGVMAAIFLPRLLEPQSASLRFKIAEAPNVSITVDGKVAYQGPNKGEITIPSLTPGERQITVSAEGFEPVSDLLQVEGGKDYEIPVKMAAAAAVDGTGVAVSVDPADAEVSLDGKKLDVTSPFTRDDLKPGKYVLIFKKDGYLDLIEEVAVAQGEIKKVEVTLRPAQVKLEIVSEPVGAEAVVYEREAGDPDKRQLVKHGKTPLSLPGLDARKVFDVEVYLEGFKPWKKTFEPGQKQDEVLIVKLEAAEVIPPVALNTPEDKNNLVDPPKSLAEQEADRKRREEATEQRRLEQEKRKEQLLAEKEKDPPKNDTVQKDPPKNDQPPATGPGYVAIISKPPARVILDGQDIGYTPKLKIQLSPGPHKAVLVMESVNVTKSYSFTIKPDSTYMIKGRP